MTATEPSPATAPSPSSDGKTRSGWRPLVTTARFLGRVLKAALQQKASIGVVLVLVVLGNELLRRSTHIDVATLPKEMTEKGYTPEAASRLLRDAMVRMVSRANVPQATLTLKTELADVTVPQTGITMQSLVNILRGLLPFGERTVISGDVIGDGSGMRLILRINGQYIGTIGDFQPDAPGKWNAAASTILHQTAPHILAWALSDENPRLAFDIADRLVARMPKDHESAGWARMLRGSRHLSLGEYASARDEFDAARPASGRNATMRAYLHSYIGRSWREENLYDDAERKFTEAIRQDPTEPRVYHSYALNERSRALARAYEAKAADPTPHLARATALFESGKVAYQRYIAAHPGDANARVNFSLLLFDMGISPEAVISELAKAAELDPDSPRPQMTLCYIHVTILDAADMPDACTAAQSFAPDHPDVHAMLARFHYNNANWSAALRANMRAIELDPESPNHYAFRMHLFAHDQPSDADALRKLAARVNRDKATALSDQALEELRKLASENKIPDGQRIVIAGRAVGLLEESRRLNPADASTYHYIAVARRQATGRLDPAEEESLSRYALAAQPSDINAALKLADFLHQAGRLDDAHKIYKEVIRKFPGHAGPHDAYVGFLKKNADTREQFSVAMTIEFRRWALAGSVFSTEDVTDTADQLLRMGHNNDALFMFGQALSKVGIDPTSAAGQFHLGNLLHKLGRVDWAMKHYVQAIKLDASASNDTNDNLLLVVNKDNEKRPPDGIHLEWPLEADLATFRTAACTVIGERTKEADKSKLKQRLIVIDPRLKNQIDCRR